MSIRPKRREASRDWSDAELVAAACAGDSKAFGVIYNAHADYTFALIGRLVGPVNEREDLLQDVFVRFHHALPRFRGDSSVRTFIARIAVNRSHDHLRKRRRRREDLWVNLEQAIGATVDGTEKANAACDTATVLRCLEEIRPKKRVAFVLRVVCEMSYGEIAELLDVKPDAARQRVGHARRELEALLAKEGVSAYD